MWTHYSVSGNEVKLFYLATCDDCGEDCEAPNAVNGTTKDIPKYLGLKMKLWKGDPLDELTLCDNGDCVCEKCYHIYMDRIERASDCS